MKIGEIMSPNPQSIGPNEFVTHAREIMREYNYESLPVVEGGRVMGIVTIQDIINVTSTRSDVTVNGYIRAIPHLTADTGLARAAFMLINTSEGRVPVVDGDRLIGMLSIKDIFKCLSELDPEDGPVRDHMTKKVVACQPEDSISKVWINMINYDLTGFPVINMKQEVIGMLTREDVMKRGYARIERESDSRRMPTTVQKIMTTPAITIDEGDTVLNAARIFMDHNIGRVPVVKNNKLAGIIDRYDVIRACRALQGVTSK